MLPTHFTLAGNELLIHLAQPNPVWPHLEAAAEVRLAVVDDPRGKAEILTAQLADFQPEGRHAEVAVDTAGASSATSNNATTGSTPGPQSSNGVAWMRSATGRPPGTGRDHSRPPHPSARRPARTLDEHDDAD